MPEDQEPGATITKPAGFSKEDWLIIDEALHRVARSLRKIEKEADYDSPRCLSPEASTRESISNASSKSLRCVKKDCGERGGMRDGIDTER
jgi:hypothetical protein